MSKIDIDKFVAQLYEDISRLNTAKPYMPWSYITYEGLLNLLKSALEYQNFQFKDGEIVEIEPKKTIYFNDQFKVIDWDKAIDYAQKSKEKLSNLEQNGKECKPANFAKSCKDLQELTEFEQELYNFMQQAQVEKRLEDADVLAEFVRKYSFVLLEKSYKQFKQDQLNQEFVTFTRQEFNDAVDEEIKRRCEGIDVDEMFDKVPPRIFKTDFDFYKKGVVDTINKLKE